MNGHKTKKLRKRLIQSILKYPEKLKNFKSYFRKTKKLYLSGVITVLILSVMNTCFPDSVQFPFPCYPVRLQNEFKESGIKLDLSGNDRTPESWGFLENKGAEFIIHTYKAVSTKDLETMRELIWRHLKNGS